MANHRMKTSSFPSIAFRSFQLAVACFLLNSLSTSQACAEEDTDEVHSEYLLGDWGGVRSDLEKNHGLSFELVATADIFSNVSGGMRQGTTVPFNFDMLALWDSAKAGAWEGGKLFVYFLGNTGGAPSTRGGELQVASNIEAEESLKLYELWYEQSFSNQTISILTGLHDYNSEFNVLEYAGTLLNSTFGIETDISQVTPSIFSTTSLTARLRIAPTENTYVMAAVYDGIPGREDNPHGTHIILNRDDGVFLGSEVGLTGPADAPADYFKLALGGWYHTKKFEDFEGREHKKNGGIYLIGEKRLWSEEDKEQGIGGFFKLGFADSQKNQVAHYFGGGLNYLGLIPTRDSDTLAIGVGAAFNGDEYQDSTDGAERAETIVELNYRAQLTEWMAVSPDIQYIINPSMDPALENTLFLGTRVEVSL